MQNKVFIIAEAGVNHNGSLALAKKLVQVASAAGADAVKFQSFKAENIVNKNAPKAEYQKRQTEKFESQFEMIKRLELKGHAYSELRRYCIKKRIMFLSSPFDFESIDLLYKMGVPIFKIPSGEITNLPYLRKIGGLKKKVILSTGMARLPEIRFALKVLIDSGTRKKNITVLHCNTEYPTPMEDVNLRAMVNLKDMFGIRVGYSDHTLGIEVPIAAVALGASVIEKHFTLDNNMEGPDHKASLEPMELKLMVHYVRNIEIALGKKMKIPSPSELKNKKILRKSIVAAKSIKKGEVFSLNNITVKRPAGGMTPIKWDEVINKIAKRDFETDEMIEV